MSERFGLSAKTLAEVARILQLSLGKKQNYAVYVFGSRATGKFRQYSDLDLWIESTSRLSDVELDVLRENFVESQLPIKIDVLTPETCLDVYRDRILSERQLYLQKSP